MVVHWYCIGKDGIATLCADKDDAEQSAKLASLDWPRNAPYRAVQLVEVDELDALQDAAQDPIRAMIKQHAEILNKNDSAYFELAYHKSTGWMCWITDKPLCMPPVINPGRVVLAQGQGDTAEDACTDAAIKKGGA